jgi:putative Holliday junction resolvase
VQLLDERLTTRQAVTALATAGLDSREQRGRVDSVAATILLQAFLDSRLAK